MRNYTKILRIYGIINARAFMIRLRQGMYRANKSTGKTNVGKGLAPSEPNRVTTFGGSKPPPYGQTRYGAGRVKNFAFAAVV